MTDEQEKFEKWAKKHFQEVRMTFVDGEYLLAHYQSAWVTWQVKTSELEAAKRINAKNFEIIESLRKELDEQTAHYNHWQMEALKLGKEIGKLRIKVESLRQQLEEKHKNIPMNTVCGQCESLRQQLAQRDARIAELRGALEEIVNHLGHPDDESTKMFRKMLSTPDDLSSLNRVRAEALREAARKLDLIHTGCANKVRRMADELESKGTE